MSIWEVSQRFIRVAAGKGGGSIEARDDEDASLTAPVETEEEGERCDSMPKSTGAGRLRDIIGEARSRGIGVSLEKLADGELWSGMGSE